MSTLHTVNRSPFERDALESCLRHALAGSAVLLFEDAVYAALAGTRHAALLAARLDECTCYALGPDLQARGLLPAQLLDGIEVVDYEGFVALAAKHERVQAWL